ncbi:MAG: hypothetical protein NVSMB47_22640 [Polyangiales bacterium]
MRASLGIVAVALAVGASGCSYPSYAFSDPLVDGAAPPADDARDAPRPFDDSSVDVAVLDAAPSDGATQDSSVADTSAPLDAADAAVLDGRVDDTARPDAARAPGCASSSAIFCEDFDSVSTRPPAGPATSPSAGARSRSMRAGCRRPTRC